jgi:hypothetical protein
MRPGPFSWRRSDDGGAAIVSGQSAQKGDEGLDLLAGQGAVELRRGHPAHGSAATLQDAVRRMAASQLDRTLTDEQVESLVAFLRTLTGNYRGSPVAGTAP